MKFPAPARLIVCILGQGRGGPMVERLSKEKGIDSAAVSSGRGRGAGSLGSIGAWDEVDTLSVTVPADRADEIFDFLFEVGELGRPRGGIMYQHAIAESTGFTLPKIEEGEAAAE